MMHQMTETPISVESETKRIILCAFSPRQIHVKKVRNLAIRLARKERAALDASRVAALLYDIARALAQGGWSNKPIHDLSFLPKEKYDGKPETTVNHVREKLLKNRRYDEH